MTTVTGIIRDTQGNALPNLGVTLRYTRPLVGFEGGAVAQNDRQFVTDGSGELVMAGLIAGHYRISIGVPSNDNTTLTVLREGTGTVPTGETAITLEAFLSEPIGQIDSTVLQQAVAAAAAAEGFANAASSSADAAALSELEAANSADEANAAIGLASDAGAAAAAPFAAAAQSYSLAASATLLTLSDALLNDLGAFSVDENGDLIAVFQGNVIDTIEISADGDLLLSYEVA